MERRNTSRRVAIEDREDGKSVIAGYAAVFHREGESGTEYELAAKVVERIAPTAFSRALADRDDARGLFNHDSSMILGRVKSGTLKLSIDDVGLRYEITPPDTQYARDAVESIRRGDVDGSSFAFRVQQQSWIEEEDRDVREIREVELFDVGPVTYPAYQSTSSGVRSATSEEDVLKSHKHWKARKARLKEIRDDILHGTN